MNPTTALPEHVISTEYESLPPNVLVVAKEVILDGIGNLLAGSQEPLSEPTVTYVKALCGPIDATVIDRDVRTHPVHAAFTNGVF